MTFFDHKLPNKISSNHIEKSELFLILNGNLVISKDQPIALICVSAIVMQINFVCTLGTAGGTLLYARNFIFGESATTPVNDTANECPLGSVSGAAPLSQFPGAVERSTLPLACVGPLSLISEGLKLPYCRNICAYTLYLPYLKTTFGNLHFILSQGQAHQVDGLVKQPHLALTR
ncbi:hypothetical protein T05_11800 [Trichinella murrelli]|uniref:Uncharacterized protein n=1 Tax=Trichinella murrelli TaxID=144512 RepID=A0A0V0T5S3_9BILA|nr:hypothetical protein T05_1037 [Trichinella murrelli]KRX34347.1 hypothetical protein T05_4563 [Trichinella murrelli]KRX34710.1 hypothetical protein T05_596 [Trichinella murrelli]KRX35633.1 hypothetical protein T05_11800 [Trichinella murrelli]